MRHFLIEPTLCVLAALAALATATAATPPAPAMPAAATASAPMPGHGSMALAPRKRPAPVEHYVDINSASRKELMTLPGIGKAEADKIVAHRPYLTKTELVSKGALATGPFLSIKRQVVAMPKTPLDKKKASKLAAAAPQASGPKAP